MAKVTKIRKVGLGTGFMIGIAIIYLLFGLAMIFVPQFQERYIIYIAGLLFLICGVIMIVKYFVAASYNDLGNYGFSGGVLAILLGICLLVRTQQIAGYLPLFLGVCILLTAVIKLQNAVDLKSLKNGGWPVFLIIALVFLAAAILVILNPGGKVLQHREVLYYILIADGAVSIISPIYLVFAIRAGKRVRHIDRRTVETTTVEKNIVDPTEDAPEKTDSSRAEQVAASTGKEKIGKKWFHKDASEVSEAVEEPVDDPEESDTEDFENQEKGDTDTNVEKIDPEEETMDHISEEILGFFNDEDK